MKADRGSTGQSGGGPLEIVVFTRDGVITRPLPRSGSVILGRDADVDVCVPDPSVSRRHARLYIGPPLRVEDLGSRNGTRLIDRGPEIATAQLTEVQPCGPLGGRPPGSAGSVQLAPGEAIHLGVAQVVVRRREPGPAGEPRAAVVIADPAMRALYDLAERLASSPIHVILLGETGAGKEVLAEFLHRASPRAGAPFLCLSCISLSESLLESELFGHERGAFTGAVRAKPGLLETAGGGTVFLDEIGELPLSIQAKLLRVIEERKVTRVGGLAPKSIDVRFLSATNRDLEAEVARGAFRRDLYFRLNGITLTIPPLQERLGEIEALAMRFAARAAAEVHPGHAVEISKEALAALRRHTWPGNIRELRNVMERAVVLAGGPRVEPEHLLLGSSADPPEGASRARRTTAPPPAEGLVEEPPAALGEGAPHRTPVRLRDALEAHERKRILQALDQCAGNQTRAAALLGISRRTLVDRLRAYGIPRPRKA